MDHAVPWLLPAVFFCVVVAIASHLVVSFFQTLLHYRLGHRPLGGRLRRNHLNFHHAYYSKDRMVSPDVIEGDGNNTPFFLIPVALVCGALYFVLPLYLLAVVLLASASSFYAHVVLDKAYHLTGSWFLRFAWFRRKQALHFVHHRHANSNFAVIDFFWDRLLGTFRAPDGPAH